MQWEGVWRIAAYALSMSGFMSGFMSGLRHVV